ncbi:heterokaryon incompatibility Het-C [Eremomyces bilateralis CBS 781.70]|uniref:Heterokaryon incompatibility Het-C n=1 Tax=Eremomyces bilateralis CBS 781.70 TaxID=1392243 RepID=A0A6G1G8C3_9PEZI|nr:heterokaryon incompatibility Het-C [Eremomyces bilateralis CBS 781.70]KAF1814317.1 heterokaryon incompatibility Het-C [Eremomyces bilateralis CBS 781.70]
MKRFGLSSFQVALLFLGVLLLCTPVSAFGAGNIASISKVEGKNWRHGDIEDMLKKVACLRHHKWSSLMIRRVYFGNWLRDYSQALDVGTLKGVQADTIRVLVWILAFMSFGYATAEFEVTPERLGVYRAEEHIDNPRDYADNQDARQYDQRLRGPVHPQELAVDPNTGMKNYIANESGGWATSTGYVKHSLARSIHFGRMYTSGAHGTSGKEEDLCEALRCLGQALHCLEDWGAHTNYTELVLKELGFHDVFPHTGTATQMNVHGKHIFPLVTGTFGGVDFLHSVLGEATDHFTQSEIDEMNVALGDASSNGKKGGSGGASGLADLLGKVPGTQGLIQEAHKLQDLSNSQAAANSGQRGFDDPYETSRASHPPGGAPTSFAGPPGSTGGPPGPGIPGMNPNLDPTTIIPKIYPILQFRDKVVRSISAIISKIPGLESLIDTISEKVTIFVMSLLAPFIQPIIKAASAQLKQGSSSVIDASGKHQYEPWTDPNCTDPTHSFLSKDHFSNILNEPAGQVASTILQYVAPRVIFSWENPGVPVQEVLNDVVRVFHHPALRQPGCEIHEKMFSAVDIWVRSRPDGGRSLNQLLGSESVRAGHNHVGGDGHGHGHGHGSASQGKVSGSPFDLFTKKREADLGGSGSGYQGSSTSWQQPEAFGAGSNTAPGPYASQPPYQGGYEQQYQSNQPYGQEGQYPGQGPPGQYQQNPPPHGGYGQGYGGAGY